MKSFKEVEATRRDYHRDGGLNTVHRASLMVPEIDGSQAEVSFLNHFLLKRGYEHVSCRVTALDPEGTRIESRLVTINEPRVYTLPLSGLSGAPASAYLIEFFSADNLYIPFPAVMINHRGERHLNTVHAYNRVLNDVFEDDAINSTHVSEASIDVAHGADDDTFVMLTAGLQPCRGQLSFELTSGQAKLDAHVDVTVPRLCHQKHLLSSYFPDHAGGVLKIAQPPQFMFYGRLLCGVMRKDGAFTANHSYYDSSPHPEYWDDDSPSFRLYPYLPGLRNTVRMYPIMSPGTLDITIELHDTNGDVLGASTASSVQSPGSHFLDLSIETVAEITGIQSHDISAFAVYAKPQSGQTPTRINHQLIHTRGELPASVNVSLMNSNVFQPSGKSGFAWGQMPVGGDVESTLGIVGNAPHGETCEITLTLYDEGGLISERAVRMHGGSALTFTATQLLDVTLDSRNVWYTLSSARPDISAFVVSRHTVSNHCSGEHSF